MNNPQSLADDLSSYTLDMISDYGCCAFCALWCSGFKGSDLEAIQLVQKAIDKHAIDYDCTVKWYDFFEFIGKPIKTVEFKTISSLIGLKEKCCVRYDFNGKSHWVGVEKGKIKFNPLKESVCVKYGKPTSARILYFE